MNIYDILTEIQDVRKEGTLCEFNGYLEDYLGLIENDADYDVLKKIFEVDNDFKIIKDLKLAINNNAVSNKIIRYKDIEKVGKYPIKIKYLLYTTKNDKAKALILDDHFILTKAKHYVLTEKPGEFYDHRKDILVCSLENKIEDIERLAQSLFNNNSFLVQREIERYFYESYDQSLEIVLKLNQELEKETLEKVATNKKHRALIIKEAVAKWFLLKKFVFVQYMIDRRILAEIHNQDIQKQRSQARRNTEKIRFVPYCELWKITKTSEN